MTDGVHDRALQVLKLLRSDDRKTQEAVDRLIGRIGVGNITNATGIAIGANIRQVVNHFNLPTSERLGRG